MRYFVELAYRGTPFAGWQRQPNALSVQECIEASLEKILHQPVTLVGCGRTDAGVHASSFFAHFDIAKPLPQHLLYRINRDLPDEISVKSFSLVGPEYHARFDAICRSYTYFLTATRDPFNKDLAYAFYAFHKLDQTKMRQAASIIRQGNDFQAFCKSNSDTKHYLCRISDATWKLEDHNLIFQITANRFVRGMVRLIVGMSIQVGLGKLQLQDVSNAVERQIPLKFPLSVPSHGLYLTQVSYSKKLTPINPDRR
ncbi:MAG: tRNA pseudouridine(38-40) synthase TruA [Saprospiraceae bacterium]|nr:tRNA pseudouridine(38-40) synthase TruA [Saprospiraceae bacterium]